MQGAMALPLALAALLFAGVTGAHGSALIAFAPACLAVASGRRFALSAPAQMLILLACGALGVLLAAFVPRGEGRGSEDLRAIYAIFGLAALLFAGARLHVAAPSGGHPATLAAGLVAFLACGTVRSGQLFPLLLAGYLCTGFLALHRVDLRERSPASVDADAPPPSASWHPRRALALALLLAVAASLTVALAALIPRLHAKAYDMALDWIGERAVSGFHDGPMRLGSLHGLLQSDVVVARVLGRGIHHLRGNVYGEYQGGRWLPAGRGTEVARVAAAPGEGGLGAKPVRAEVRYAAEDLDRFFLPAVAGELELSPQRVRVDEMGVTRVEEEEHPRLLRLLAGGKRAFEPAPPGEADLALPASIAGSLRDLAGEWTRGAETPRARSAAIRARLVHDYAYSLEFDRDTGPTRVGPRLDPILDFLVEQRRGHCEYFAAAMTLLARASGSPARLVTGYLVDEYNPLGDYYIVRERHAHAWSEVHLPDAGWVTFDPTPLHGTGGDGARQTRWPTALLDAGRFFGRAIWRDFGAEASLVALVVGLAAAQVWRLWRGRAPGRVTGPELASGPPACVERLLDRLAAEGAGREASESLEALGRRLRRDGGRAATRARSAGELVSRYAAHRYGGVGSLVTLQRDIERWLAEPDAPCDLTEPGP